MIHELRVLNHKNTPIPWWPQVERFKRRTVFKFQPGMNILWGPNGVGKSTLLKALARVTQCEQGGVFKVTTTSVGHFRAFEERRSVLKRGFQLTSDDQQVYHYDPNVSVGLFGGAFDYDFFDEAMHLTLPAERLSSGQGRLTGLNRVLAHLAQGPKKVEWPDMTHARNDHWLESYQAARDNWVQTAEDGPTTLLLDEPSRSLDLVNQTMLWTHFRKLTDSGKVQIIIATHAYQALAFRNAHFIDMQKGYLDQCRKAFASTVAHWEEP